MVTKKTYAHTDMLHPDRENTGTLFLFVSVSTVFHFIFFAVLIFLPDFSPKKKFSMAAINVSLVSIPDAGKPAVSSNRTSVTRLNRAKNLTSTKNAAKTISIAPRKIKVKKSLKKKTFKSDKVVKSAISELKKKVDESTPKPITKALERLKREVEQTAPVRHTETKGVTGSNTGTYGKPDAKGEKTPEIMQIYNAEIAWQIKKNWVFSEDFAQSSSDLEAALAIRIASNGEIQEIWFDKKSGNSFLDDSAYKAIMKSNPLPPLPKGFSLPYYTVGFLFGPKGIK
ncbi:MAG: energy transducer TonB [Thermodesulfobacteriota bacterium]|nr:energy transducer TonB [Thermodesulfobacteriota bacterium]